MKVTTYIAGVQGRGTFKYTNKAKDQEKRDSNPQLMVLKTIILTIELFSLNLIYINKYKLH